LWLAPRENTERLNVIDLLERGGQEVSPLLAHDPLHSMRPTHDVNLQTIVQEATLFALALHALRCSYRVASTPYALSASFP
jgi:hypothetical protein